MRNKETKAHTLCYKKIHNFKNKNWKLKKKDTLICILIHDWPDKKTTHANIMRFYLITWYFSLSNLSWIVINRRSNRLQRKQEHKYDLYYCTCIHRQHQNVVKTTDWHTWGSKVCQCFLPNFWCLQWSTVTVQTHGKMESLCYVYVITWPQG